MQVLEDWDDMVGEEWQVYFLLYYYIILYYILVFYYNNL